MNTKLEQAFKQVQKLPAARQEEVGDMLLSMVAQEELPSVLTDQQADEVRVRLLETNTTASKAEVETFFQTFA